MKLAVTGGGTGGHVYPAFAVIEQLREMAEASSEHFECFWIGSRTGMERDIVTKEGIRYRGVPSGKLRRYLSLKNLLDAFRVLGGLFASFWILMREKPDVLFSKGGYVSVPPVWAASLLHIPVISHESDIDLGLASRLNLKKSKMLCVAYDIVKTGHPHTIVSGNPLRAALFDGSAERGRAFVGAALNELVASTLPDLVARGYFVVHQHGGLGPEIDSEQYKGNYFGIATLSSSEMADLLPAARAALARAGAGSLWELGVHRVPSLLAPLSARVSRGDQERNAAYFVSQGCNEVLIDDTHAADERCAALLKSLDRLINDEPYRKAMQEKLALLCKAHAAAKIATGIRELAGLSTPASAKSEM